MPPRTALVSALSLPVANYSSAHLADLLAERERRGGESDKHDPSETWNIPAICRLHSCLPNQERKQEKCEGITKRKSEWVEEEQMRKSEKNTWKQTEDEKIRKRKTSQMTWFLGDRFNL